MRGNETAEVYVFVSIYIQARSLSADVCVRLRIAGAPKGVPEINITVRDRAEIQELNQSLHRMSGYCQV